MGSTDEDHAAESNAVEPDLAEYLEAPGIISDPTRARLRRYGIEVWALVGYWLGVGRDACRTSQDYDIPREYLDAALCYYERHQAAIDVRIAQNTL